MNIYFDSSLLVSLYLPEARTLALREWFSNLRVRVGLNLWQELEFRNAARQKAFRGEANDADLARTFRVFEDDCVHGRVIRRTVPWEAAFAEAELISRKFASSTPCRSFDLLHVSIATVSRIPEFATLDSAQAELARKAGLKIVPLPQHL